MTRTRASGWEPHMRAGVSAGAVPGRTRNRVSETDEVDTTVGSASVTESGAPTGGTNADGEPVPRTDIVGVRGVTVPSAEISSGASVPPVRTAVLRAAA